MDNNSGYSMPLPVKYWPRAGAGIIWLGLAAVCLASLFPEFRTLVELTDTKRQALNITALVTGPLFLAVAASSFLKLHIQSQGITLTLFGLTVRQIPVETIHIISAVQYSNKVDAVDQIALCLLPLPEILKKERTDLTEETRIYYYIYRKSRYFRINLNLNREILWLDWSVERAKLLMEMYPNARWVDGSPDSRFDKQL